MKLHQTCTAAALGLCFVIAAPSAHAVSVNIVISQIYGGGGNVGATFTNDFIELFNRDVAPVSLDGWSVQYASATGSVWQVTNLSGILAPGEFYLIQEAAGAGGTTSLPTPDAIGTIAMSANNGKVAVVNTTVALNCSLDCLLNANIIDLVGYGSTASSFEGDGPAAMLTNTLAALRLADGAQDTDNNAADFVTGVPNPRNSAVAETPLPATLSLFATGLGPLGLIGWRRKKKAAAFAA